MVTEYDESHAARFLESVVVLLTPEDVRAVTIHREMGAFRYERLGGVPAAAPEPGDPGVQHGWAPMPPTAASPGPAAAPEPTTEGTDQ